MKKILLPIIALMSGVTAYSQTADDCAVYPGLSETYVGLYEDGEGTGYGTEDDGLYWWDDNETNTIDFVLDRETNTGITMTISQLEDSYDPIGVGFGGTEEDPVTIDLTKNGGDFSFTFENKSDAVNLKVRISAQDVNGNNLDTEASYEGSLFSNAWQFGIEETADAGETIDFEGTFDGGTYADYANDQYTAVDLSKIKAILFTVINAESNAAFGPLAMTDVEVVISDIHVGACPTGIFSNETTEATFTAYPNPTVGTTTFSKEVTNVVVYNSNGNIVETLASATELNTESFDAGIYMVKSDQGTVRLVVE